MPRKFPQLQDLVKLAACKILARKNKRKRDSAVWNVNDTSSIDGISLQNTSGWQADMLVAHKNRQKKRLTQALSVVATPGEGGCVYVFSRNAPRVSTRRLLRSAEHSKL